MNFAGIDGVEVRASGGGTLELRWGAADAEPFATVTVPGGAGWQTVRTDLTDLPTGTGELFVTSSGELAVDSLEFQGDGVADVTAPTVTHTLAPAAPTGVGGAYNVPVTLALAPQDDGAVASVQYSANDGGAWTTVSPRNGAYTVPFTTDGARTLVYRATDTGGNVSAQGSVAFTIDLDAPNEPTEDSTTTITAPSARVVYGAPGEVTVTVGAAAGDGADGTPTGDVVVTSGTTEVGRGTLTEGAVTIKIDRTLAVGSHTLKAPYLADEVFKTSAGSARLTVAAASSTITGSVSPDPVKPAIAAKATIAVETSTGVVPTGDVTVTIKRNNAIVATRTGTLADAGTGTGTVVVTLPKLAQVGTYKVELGYPGQAGITKSATSLSLTVRN